jgi:hypothetical protein
MKKLATISILLLLLNVVGACSRADRAIDATNSMPQRMDETNRKMDETNRKIDQTNKQMQETNDVVSQQPVQITFEDMLKPEFGQDLTPVPFDLMPFAKVFGQYAKPDDVIEIVYLWMKKLNELPLTPTMDEILNGKTSTPLEVDAFNHHLLQVYMALESVCGFLPDDKVDAIVQSQIINAGARQNSALQLLMLRVDFIKSVLLDASLMESPLDNIGKIEKAIAYADSIDKIARLPFAADISATAAGFKDPYPAVNLKLDTGVALKVWQSIHDQMTTSMTLSTQVLSGNTAKDQELLQDRKDRAAKAAVLVNDRIKFWTTK